MRCNRRYSRCSQLSSPKEGVRKKVMELLVHVNKRVKGNERIRPGLADAAAAVSFLTLFLSQNYCGLENDQTPFWPSYRERTRRPFHSTQHGFLHCHCPGQSGPGAEIAASLSVPSKF